MIIAGSMPFNVDSAAVIDVVFSVLCSIPSASAAVPSSVKVMDAVSVVPTLLTLTEDPDILSSELVNDSMSNEVALASRSTSGDESDEFAVMMMSKLIV